MRHITIYIAALFLLIAGTLEAQSFEFRVLANRGQNMVKVKDATDWRPVKTGTTLFAGSQIKLIEGGYMGLMHKSGKTIEVKTKGVHNIDDLSKKVLSKGSSVASQYGEFLMAKMSASDGDEDISASRLNNLNVTGAVSRASGDEAEIQVFLPQTSRILDFNDSKIKWKEMEESTGYKLFVENLFSETIAEMDVTDNSFDLANLGINIEAEGGLFIRITDNTDTSIDSAPHAIEMVNGKQKSEVVNNLMRLKGELTNEDVSLNKLILAMFYEENKLYLHAFSCYHEVLEEYPDVDFYKSAYLEFVERNKDKF
jgi:hypothetical protein